MKWRKAKCRCKCGRTFYELVSNAMTPRYSKHGDLLPFNVECDTCAQTRMTPAAWAEYQRVVKLLRQRCEGT